MPMSRTSGVFRKSTVAVNETPAKTADNIADNTAGFGDDISLVALEAFLIIANERQFKTAARRLKITAPTLSRHIQRLERTFGQRLFRRSTAGAELTCAGMALLEHVKTAIRALHQGKKDLLHLPVLSAGLVRLGAIESVATYWIPSLSPIVSQRLPQVELQLQTAPISPDLETMVANGEVDMAITNGTETLRDDLVRTVLWKEDYVLCVPSNHRLSARASVTLDEIADEPFIVSPACWGSTPIETICRRKGITPNIRLRTESLPIVQRMVEAGLGIAMMPRVVTTVPSTWSASIVELADNMTERTVVLLHRGSDMLGGAARQILGLIIEFRTLGPQLSSSTRVGLQTAG